MPNIIRKIFTTLNGTVMRRLVPSRRNIELPIQITVEPSKNTGKLTLTKEILSLKGETKDLSVNGIAFCVDSIRLREHYLVGEKRILNAEIDLPNGTIKMQIMGQRYEQIGEHLSVNKYLIGASIIDMDEMQREIYEEYLQFGYRMKPNKTPVLDLEVTKN
jgi:hypothetical protein